MRSPDTRVRGTRERRRGVPTLDRSSWTPSRWDRLQRGVRKRTDRERKEDKDEMPCYVNTLIKYSFNGKYPVFVPQGSMTAGGHTR